MNKLVLIVALCLLPAAVAPAFGRRQRQQQPASQNESAKPAPTPQRARPTPLEVISEEIYDHELKDLDGRGFYLSNYRGQVFVINVWASWCGPCRKEIPVLNKIYEEYRGRGVEFVGLTVDRPVTKKDAKAVREFIAEFNVKYKLGWLDSELFEIMMNDVSVPQTIVVGPNGKLDTHFIGYSEWEKTGLRQSIENALTPYTSASARPRP